MSQFCLERKRNEPFLTGETVGLTPDNCSLHPVTIYPLFLLEMIGLDHFCSSPSLTGRQCIDHVSKGKATSLTVYCTMGVQCIVVIDNSMPQTLPFHSPGCVVESVR